MMMQIRHVGYALIATGLLIVLSYLITPFRAIWPYFRSLPGPVQFAIAALFFGFLLIMTSLFAERTRERDYDRSLHDD